MKRLAPNFAFEADVVRQRTVSCRVRAPRGTTWRWADGTTAMYSTQPEGHPRRLNTW